MLGVVMNSRQEPCAHLGLITTTYLRPRVVCERCVADGGGWSTLRVCLSCGEVNCAEGSANDHAAAHYAETDHPIAAAVGSQPASRWCYPDGRFV